MGIAVTFVMGLASAVCYVVDEFVLGRFGLDYMQTVAFILVIAALVQFIEMFLQKSMPSLYTALGIYLPLITTNCAVLGVVLLNVQNNYNFIESVVYGVTGGLGFLLAIVLFASIGAPAVRGLSQGVEGFPIALVDRWSDGLAFMGFSGLKVCKRRQEEKWISVMSLLPSWCWVSSAPCSASSWQWPPRSLRVKKDPPGRGILSHLAGANCGGCGFPGCAGCAAAILAGTAPVNACAPAGAENAAAIAKIMGQEAPSGERKVAFVRCNGGTNAAKRYEYVGVKDCLSATKVAGGPLECQFGCLGFGSCVSACQFGAMSIGPNGAAVVDPDKCTDCMACAKACPRHLITEVPVSKKVHVACANQDKGKAAMSVCTHSCIGCGLCQKECKKDAIHVVNGVAVIDYDKCVGCKLCTKVCPRDAILPIATAEEKEKYKAIKKAQAEKAAAAKAAETAGAAQ